MRIKKKNEHIIKCHSFFKIIKILSDKILKSKMQGVSDTNASAGGNHVKYS